MSEMKLIMENWRKRVLEEQKSATAKELIDYASRLSQENPGGFSKNAIEILQDMATDDSEYENPRDPHEVQEYGGLDGVPPILYTKIVAQQALAQAGGQVPDHQVDGISSTSKDYKYTLDPDQDMKMDGPTKTNALNLRVR